MGSQEDGEVALTGRPIETARVRLSRIVPVSLCVLALFGASIGAAWSAPVIRVCADPDNLPYSNEKGEGFENKLAELIAERVGRSLEYVWFDESTGYAPNTMGEDACDLVMGYAQGTGLIEDSNPYYYTSYVLITRASDEDLKGLKTLSDPRLKSKRIGVFARTPPLSILALHGLVKNAKPFEALSSDSQSKAAEEMIEEIVSGRLDAGILWGPVGGYYAEEAPLPLSVVPLNKEKSGPTTFYGITLGIRPNEPQFKHEINKVLAENQSEIDVILRDYNVPILNREGEIIAAGESL